uniref:CUE domain-containing protein n=2 Tax=Photinus pyralis TaxID=7054 RepID=A0A1Y1L0H2_PHOPY
MDTICSRVTFKNPNKEPLNRVYLEFRDKTRISKKGETLENLIEMLTQSPAIPTFQERYKDEVLRKPALDECWIEKKSYQKFVPYLLHSNESGNRNFQRNESFLRQLQFLVDCSYRQFWCYVVYDSNVISMIKDFLQNSVPLRIITHLNKNHFDLYNQIHCCVMAIFRRLLDFNVSEVEYLEEDTVRDIFQKTELFDIGTVFTLCYLYNFSEPDLMKQIIDFCRSSKNRSFVKHIDGLLSKVGMELEHFLHASRLGPKVMEDTAFFLYEMASGLNEFLSACDDAIVVAFGMDLPFGIMCVYQKVYSEIEDVLEMKKDWVKQPDLLKQWVAYGKFEFVNTVHIFTTHCIDAIVSYRTNSAKQDNAVELYISLISNALDNELFVISYNETYPVRDQFQILVDSVANFDSQQTNYLLASLDSIIKEFNSATEEVAPPTTPCASHDNGRNYVEECRQMCATLSQFLERSQNKKNANLPRSISLVLEQYYDLVKHLGVTDGEGGGNASDEHNVRAVLDVLPHLSGAFVEKCLERYNSNPNEVIAHVLNGDLPSDLADVSLFSQPSTSEFAAQRPIGKKWNDLNVNSMLDDKKEKEKIKEFILKAQYTFDLDDEYDDRVEVGRSLNDSDNESRIMRHLGKEEDESEESQSEEEKRNTSKDFCVDPALLREKRAQQYQHHQSNRTFRPSKNGNQSHEKPPSKSTKPKHNRRQGATWKRNKGMIPS